MTLEQYLKENDITHAEFALEIGKSRSMVTQLCKRMTNPSYELAKKIVKASEDENGRPQISWDELGAVVHHDSPAPELTREPERQGLTP